MRIEGRLTRWDDERGFGFITPFSGGQDIFAHIKAFGANGRRPEIDESYSFEVELGPEGKKRARKIQPIVARRPIGVSGSRRGMPWGGFSLFSIPAFALLFVLVAFFGRVPKWLALAYLGLSALCFVVYWLDKRAAAADERRTPESTLHWLALLGGWPGALLAQQFLRHKSVKREFRMVFWATVLLNVAGFCALVSPFGQRFLLQFGA